MVGGGLWGCVGPVGFVGGGVVGSFRPHELVAVVVGAARVAGGDVSGSARFAVPSGGQRRPSFTLMWIYTYVLQKKIEE